MIVVHGLVLPDGTLGCWAESPAAARPAPSTPPPAEPDPDPAVSATGPTAAARTALSRDALSRDALSRDAVDSGDATGTAVHPFAVLPPLPGTVTTADLLLPSTPSRPGASPELAAHLPAGHREPAARRQTVWTVPVVVLPAGTDPEQLLTGDPGTAPGSSIGYLADLLSFATSLVDRGRFLPALTTESTPASLASLASPGRGPAGRWLPVLWGADAAAFDVLCGSMPGVTAAVVPEPAAARLKTRTVTWSTADAARQALTAVVDHLVRARLRGRPLLTDAQSRHTSAVHAWLSALTTADPRLRTLPPGTATPAPPSTGLTGPAGLTGVSPAALTARAEARAIAEAAARRGATSAPPADPSTDPSAGRSASASASASASSADRVAPAPAAGPAVSAVSASAPLTAHVAGRDDEQPSAIDATTDGGTAPLPAAALPPPAGGQPQVPGDGPPPGGQPTAARPGPGATPDGTTAALGTIAAPGTASASAPPEHLTARANQPAAASARSAAAADDHAPASGPAVPDAERPKLSGAAAGGTPAPLEAPESGASAEGRGAFMADGPEVARLREVLERWADSGRPAPVRLCFRLSYVEGGDEDDDDLAPPPEGDLIPKTPKPAGRAAARRRTELPATPRPASMDEDGGSWLVEFLLQPAEEPGLLVPAADVWHDAASPLFKWVDYPQDVLLADLGRAARLWADLDEALWAARPESLRLDTIGAYRFLTHATLLHDAGFGVLLPAQWQRRQELGLTLTVRTKQPAAPVLRDTTTNRAAIVAYRWGLAIGDEFLSEADLAELARAKVPLVRLRGRWVHLDRERLRAGLAFLRRGGRGEMTAGEAMRLTRLVPDGDLPLPVTGVDGEGWLADLLTGRAAEHLELLDPPAGLTATLRPYQRRGLSWLAFLDAVGVGALLADDMGLGKTVQVLALEAHLRSRGPRPPTLIVCPLSVLGNWRREIERFTPGLTVRVHHGAARLTGTGTAADLVLTTYQVATRDIDTLAATAWDRVVLDEAQHVKNATGVTARAVRRLPARHRVALTGTPVENRLTELWSIADFLNPGLLGEASIFRARYSVPVERWGDDDAARRLRRVTRPFLLRRVKTDRAVIADLPEKVERRQWCNLTLEQATLYKAVVDELFVKLREGRAGPARKGLVLSAMTKLKQVCNHPAHLMGDGTPLPGRSGKLARLEEILSAALAAGDRALVFTQFARFGHLLVPHLAQQLGAGVEFLHGGTPKGARDRMVDRFQSGSGPGVLLVSLKAGGTGLNLTAANHVVHVDRWWNPAAEAQATDRAFRIGQRRDVQVHTFVCIGTIEERVEEIMASKRDLAGVAVGSGEGWLTGLSTNDLLDLMSLGPEAVGDA
ncbi:DEAD/DEAH box helicase [Dactylosporangium sp. CS-033363]|uniref:DEAD/DEAH box helicase n=1 Tax=Dactylosporangium sp. CS-033363 TaxID=3239935 RepID=UPI003D8AA6D9